MLIKVICSRHVARAEFLGGKQDFGEQWSSWTEWLLVLTRRLCADKRKRSSRTEEPFLSPKLREDQTKKNKTSSQSFSKFFLQLPDIWHFAPNHLGGQKIFFWGAKQRIYSQNEWNFVKNGSYLGGKAKFWESGCPSCSPLATSLLCGNSNSVSVANFFQGSIPFVCRCYCNLLFGSALYFRFWKRPRLRMCKRQNGSWFTFWETEQHDLLILGWKDVNG